ncbi:uncharacterized protein F4822DRAFT_425018 [Hypoxylon trugodes]|uniref:uncharacterized protein n=1 Tax=Hypoxylon trugodes TaxID=326681 RepID=UPI002196D56E|nr:uncharacterized protein F4822DRAFT_425018 [Hypoxylon trugodes]KAI1391800.1 hypothetical protein F4822DRAFT_425018 [Hypoxylon trugodes]
MANFHAGDSFMNASVLPEASQRDKTIMTAAQHGSSIATPRKTWPIAKSPSTNSTNQDPFTPDISNYHEDTSGSDTISEDGDLDLEKSADDALSQWFGISLHRLIRPAQIIYAFELCKRQCAGILEDEGHNIPDAQDNDENQDIQMDPCDAGEGSRSAGGSGTPLSNTGSPPFNDKKHLRGNTLEQGSSPDSCVATKRKYKKRRVPGQFSCPYRKRNPIRFNVHGHEKCANKSYPDMSELKKHLTSDHFKESHICARCHEQFPPRYNMLLHYAQCPFPPQPQTNPQPTDPEDGFDRVIDERLKSRGKGKVDDWSELYRILFPYDKVIPDSHFIPVVEDHEVFYEYERSKDTLFQRLSELISQQYHHSVNDQDRIVRDIMDLSQDHIKTVLKRPMTIPQALQSPQIQVPLEPQRSQCLENDFFDITMERGETVDGSTALDQLVETLGTPQYLSPEDSHVQMQEEPLQYYDSSQDLDFPINYYNQQITEAFEHPPGSENIQRQVQPRPNENCDARAPGLYRNISTAGTETNFWPGAYQNYGQGPVPLTESTLSTLGMHLPTMRGTPNLEDLWMSNSNYGLQEGGHEDMAANPIFFRDPSIR